MSRVFPNPRYPDTDPGLTKREFFAALVMIGLCNASFDESGAPVSARSEQKRLADAAVSCADALMTALAGASP